MDAIFLQSGIISASLQVILDKFSTFAQKEIGLLLGVDDELKKLERTLLKVQALVDNVKSKQQYWSCSNKGKQLWLHDLQSILHDADDLLDEISLELVKLSSNGAIGNFTSKQGQVSHLVLSQFKFNIPSQMVKMTSQLDDIAREMDGAFIDYIVKSNQNQPNFIRKQQTSALVNESCVIGRRKDKDEIVKILLSEEITAGEHVSVTAIVGMAGVGKTTLAQLVYNDEKVVQKFDLRIWVSVSVEYTVERITKSIVECASRKLLELLDLDPMQMILQEILNGKKFLIVLDGLWDENTTDWDVLCLPFNVAARGRKVLVTTQSMSISKIVATTPGYHLQTLSVEDCWALIKQVALANINQNDCKDLVDIGLRIAEKCKGLPLAAKVLGSVRRFKSDEKGWEVILKSKLWDLPENENKILPALKLSYDHLPSCLKRCFAYCALFPTNYDFRKEDLVELWVAEGFVQPKGVARIEDTGKEYFDVLFWRSFFQFSHLDHNNQSIYKMHNLVQDLAQFVSDGLCFRMEDNMSLPWPNIRHARYSSLLCKDIQPSTLKVFHKCSRLRTLVLFPESGSQIKQIPYDFFLNLRSLRLLNLSFTNITELPDSIGSLKHLRYLDVSETHIEKLPESITNLYGLQTLKLNNCFKFLHLPKNMKNFSNLRNLELDIKRQINSMPPEFGRLTSLQTLSAFIVGKEQGQCIEELKDMSCLQGSICITGLENVASVKEAISAKLDEKPYLDRLELQWNVFKDDQVEQSVLAGLQPHNRIKELVITSYGGFMFPSWLSNPSFYRLGSIYLQNCRYCKCFPALGKLPMLRSLYIDEMYDLIYVDGESNKMSSSFPSLESLTLRGMLRLQEWKDLEAGDMPQLQLITIVHCPNLNFLPRLHYLRELETLEITHCPKLQSLPIGGLPNSLKSLIIIECDILRERCKSHEGEDWNKIRSIPRVEIDYEEILARQNQQMDIVSSSSTYKGQLEK